MLPGLLIGLAVGSGIGAALTAGASWLMLRRHLRRVRAAERQSRSAERLGELAGMTSGLAHEIRNPLSTIGLNAQLLLEGVQDASAVLPDADRASLVNRAKALRRETDRLSGILGDFLQFAGQVNLERRDADLNTVVGELVDFFTPECERCGVRLRADLAAAPVLASIDVKLTKQALLNLLINATQAMSPEGGNATPGGAMKDLIVRVRDGKDTDGLPVAEVHVIDTGPGIAPELVAKIFTPYFTTKSSGTGLGLPTARRLIEAHTGRIDVHSELGRGTDFTVVLPKRAPQEAGR